MLYSYIVKKRIRQTFEDVNNHRWDEAVKAVAPHVHHRVSGAHALGGERHDKEALRRWFERLGPCGGAESMHSRNFKIHKQRPGVSPPKRQLAAKKLPPNKF